MAYDWKEGFCFLENEKIAFVSSNLRVIWEIIYLVAFETPNFSKLHDVRIWVEITDRRRRSLKSWKRKRSEYICSSLSNKEKINRILFDNGSYGPKIKTGIESLIDSNARPINRNSIVK